MIENAQTLLRVIFFFFFFEISSNCFTHLFFRWKMSVVSMDQTITAKLGISTGYLFKACVRYILSNFHLKRCLLFHNWRDPQYYYIFHSS